ncbi:MAG TPA: peptidoglycan editing factor PgeF [Vicinamibacteria bacterium]
MGDLGVEASVLAGLPGLVHAFGRRSGPAGFETREDTAARTTSLLASRGRLLLLRQVHGAAVAKAPWSGRPSADAAVASEPGFFLGIETADCLPVLIVDPRRRAVAAVHAGWRGTVAGVTRAAVAALVREGSLPADLLAALGPGIGSCCYEVGDDVKAAFGPAGAAYFAPSPAGRHYLDVRAANLGQLVESGLDEGRIGAVNECTHCRPDLYHSYRRDGPGSGRMISVVGFVGPAAIPASTPSRPAPG